MGWGMISHKINNIIYDQRIVYTGICDKFKIVLKPEDSYSEPICDGIYLRDDFKRNPANLSGFINFY